MSADTPDTQAQLLADAVAEAEETAVAEAPSPSGPAGKHTKLYWHSCAPWTGTGYGTQTGLFVPLISQLGYDCAFGAFYGLKGSRLAWKSPVTGEAFPVYPGSNDAHANDVVGSHMRHWFGAAGGIGVMLTDPWVMSPKIIGRLPMLAWTPLDHVPMIPRTREWFKISGALPVAMSRFGETQFLNEGHETVYYVPHGFNPNVFKPADRAQVRKALGIPQDKFVVGMVAANYGQPGRKSFSQAIAAFGQFQQTHPDSLLYLHTKIQAPEGEDIPAICAAAKVKPMTSDQYGIELGMPDALVAMMLSAFDVLLNPSTGEGFGLTMLEAQACGTPCIVTDFSAMPEVAPVSAGNWTVGGQPVWTWLGSNQLTPSIEEILDRLCDAYDEDAEGRQARRVSVYQHAMSNYQADHVTETYWKPVLEDAAIQFSWRDQLKAASA